MKYFLCAFDTIYLGLPSECTERVISVARTQSTACERDKQDIYISLPVLFGRADLSTPHGIVLKTKNEENKTILLVPPLDIDLEIPEEKIFSVPRSFGEVLRYCNGACFMKGEQGERLIFIIDAKRIIEDYKCEA